jgi:hypothetical protein
MWKRKARAHKRKLLLADMKRFRKERADYQGKFKVTEEMVQGFSWKETK